MRQKCIEQQTPPEGLQEGDEINHGRFIRNLKRDDVAKRYQGDNDQNPLYGFKIAKEHWKDAEEQGMLSVNLETCIHSGMCSIAIHPNGIHYYHVAIIDLGSLSGAVASPFVAQYKPAPELQNLCHFEIMPLDGTTMKWMTLADLLSKPFPRAKRLPVSAQEKERAASEYAKYQQVLQIHRWVRGQDGQLQPTVSQA
jgi:hypothetical protein